MAAQNHNIVSSTDIREMLAPIPVKNDQIQKKQIHNIQYSPRQPSPLALCSAGDDDFDDENESNNESGSYGDTQSLSLHAVETSPILGSGLDKLINNDVSNSNSDMSTLNGNVYDVSALESRDSLLSLEDFDIFNEGNLVSSPVPLFLHGDQVLIFNADVMKQLSIKYGITGQLSGTLPLAPQQNALLGFPWKLNLYEVLWCVYFKVGVLVDSDDVINQGYLNDFVHDEEKSNILINNLRQKLDDWRDEKQKEIEEQMKKLNIIKRDRKNMKALDSINLINSASMPDLQQVLNKKEREEKEAAEKKRNDREMHEKSKRNNIVFMETPSDDSKVSHLWDDKLEKSLLGSKKTSMKLLDRMVRNELCTLDVSEEKGIEKIRLNFQLYMYLKNYHGCQLLPGMRFGGTFVSYPGDPLRYHAHHIVESRDYYNDDIGLFKLCNRGRLATGVRKLWIIGGVVNYHDNYLEEIADAPVNRSNEPSLSEQILSVSRCSPKNDSSVQDTICCFSIEWAGF